MASMWIERKLYSLNWTRDRFYKLHTFVEKINRYNCYKNCETDPKSERQIFIFFKNLQKSLPHSNYEKGKKIYARFSNDREICEILIQRPIHNNNKIKCTVVVINTNDKKWPLKYFGSLDAVVVVLLKGRITTLKESLIKSSCPSKTMSRIPLTVQMAAHF